MKIALCAGLLLSLSTAFAGQPDPTPVSEPDMLGLLAIAGVALAANYFRGRK